MLFDHPLDACGTLRITMAPDKSDLDRGTLKNVRQGLLDDIEPLAGGKSPGEDHQIPLGTPREATRRAMHTVRDHAGGSDRPKQRER